MFESDPELGTEESMENKTSAVHPRPVLHPVQWGRQVNIVEPQYVWLQLQEEVQVHGTLHMGGPKPEGGGVWLGKVVPGNWCFC